MENSCYPREIFPASNVLLLLLLLSFFCSRIVTIVFAIRQGENGFDGTPGTPGENGGEVRIK